MCVETLKKKKDKCVDVNGQEVCENWLHVLIIGWLLWGICLWLFENDPGGV